ncbi:MAG TPA: SCO family protein [Nocardioides sp.]|nr:SCO family protein [Nocardioides sp.]
MRRALLAVLVLVLGIAVTACSKSSADTFAGAVLPRPYHAPATELTDTDGHPFSLADSTDKRLTLVYFGYTHCPDECPATMGTIASAMLQLDDADRRNVQVVFVTTDPARDTGPVIRDWLDNFSSSFVGLTGPLPTIKRVAIDVGIPVAKGKRLPSGGYDVTHGTQVLGLDGKNRIPVVWTLGTTAPELAHDIHQLLS